MRNIDKIEDIYPLTIIKMRYGGRYIIFQAEDDAGFIGSASGNEEVYYIIDEWLKENVYPCCYGIGDTINEAFNDFKLRYDNLIYLPF